MVVIDSSVLIGFYNINDACHNDSFRILTELVDQKEKIIISENVVSETYTVLLYKCGRKQALCFLDFIFQNDGIEIILLNEHLFQKTYLYIQQIHKKLSFIDVSLIVIAKELKIPLLTHDHDLQKIYAQHS